MIDRILGLGLLGIISLGVQLVNSQRYDIVIGGGSLSALAAAITAAQTSSNSTKILLIEPTDWPGGQLTASNVPPDFGSVNHYPENLPASFVDLLLKVAGPTWSSNPGACWVSYKCFETYRAAEYIKQWLGTFRNLDVIYNAVIKSAKSEIGEDGNRRITEITAIQRTPKDANSCGYEKLFSQSIHDWYSPKESDDFFKKVIKLRDFDVVIEATEFGDILMTAGVEVAQGVEYPDESSNTFESGCGQKMVFPFVISFSKGNASILSNVPNGSDNGYPFSLGNLNWDRTWTYRRLRATASFFGNFGINKEEQSNMNLDNDYPAGYIFLPLEKLDSSDWLGGVNLTTLYEAEQRAYGFFNYMVSTAYSDLRPDLKMNVSQTGTAHGLSKIPYIRDSRRSRRGLGGFVLTYSDLNYSNPEDNGATARHFPDTVALGNYYYADIHPLAEGICERPYPKYVTGLKHPIKPYYIPFRALTSEKTSNVLFSGKSMAQTFLANAGTRLHPSEYSSGVAAGAAAALMVSKGWNTTQQVLDNIADLQSIITGPIVNSPLKWSKISAFAARE
jgi:hypothetical protein